MESASGSFYIGEGSFLFDLKGGYILKNTDGVPDVIVIATGSEVQLVMEAADHSARKVRVVSMPSSTEFDMVE